jgi:hypothetical protein
MTIDEFFNPYDKTHMDAWVSFNTNGVWDERFTSIDISFEGDWYCKVVSKIANAWQEAYKDEFLTDYMSLKNL